MDLVPSLYDKLDFLCLFITISLPSYVSTTWYEEFLLGTRRRCYIVMLVKLAQAVLEKMFKRKYVIDPPTRDPLVSKPWYEQFFIKDP